MRGTYCKGDSKIVTREFSDGSTIGACVKAWSVFFATMRKKGWSETKPKLAMGPEDVDAITEKVFNKKKRKELSSEELEYLHAYAHAGFLSIGDDSCKMHFAIASEMIERGIPHIRRTACDGIVELIHNFRTYDPKKVSDPVLRDDWRIAVAWLKTLSSGKKFESEQFKDMILEQQISAVKKLVENIRNEMVSRGFKPKELWDQVSDVLSFSDSEKLIVDKLLQ